MTAKTVTVVGAGISGVACAERLVAAGIPVRVLDRGLRAGGRMAVRTLRGTGTPWDGHAVDIGASYFTAEDPDFVDVVTDWIERGVARPWTDGFHLSDATGIVGTKAGPMRYAAPAGLRSLVEDLVDRVLPPGTVTLAREVSAVSAADGGPLVDGEPAAAVALCMPGPQAARILEDHPRLVGTLEAAMSLTWEPVLSMTAVYESRAWPAIDGVFVNADPVLTWIADDGSRRGDGAPVLVAHAGAVLSGRHAIDPMTAAPYLLASLRRVMGLDVDPAWFEIKRWALARPIGAHEQDCHLARCRVGLAGDSWSGGPRIEAAWRSGRALGASIAAALGR